MARLNATDTLTVNATFTAIGALLCLVMLARFSYGVNERARNARAFYQDVRKRGIFAIIFGAIAFRLAPFLLSCGIVLLCSTYVFGESTAWVIGVGSAYTAVAIAVMFLLAGGGLLYYVVGTPEPLTDSHARREARYEEKFALLDEIEASRQKRKGKKTPAKGSENK